MAGGLRLNTPGRAWVGLAVLLAAAALTGWVLPALWLDWQPAVAARQPWRAFSAAFVHWSPMHLGLNLAAAAVVGALGWAARLPWPAAAAWLVAWPLGHAGLLGRPELAHYGGLSGVLHAGVMVAALWLLVRERGLRRLLGALIAAGLLVKLVLERPWGPALQPGAGWDIALAPLAHATGALAGALCAAGALAATAAVRNGAAA